MDEKVLNIEEKHENKQIMFLEDNKTPNDGLWLKVFSTTIMLVGINYASAEIASIIPNAYISALLKALFIPLINFLLLSGMTVGLIDYYLEVDNFFIGDIFLFFHHRRRVVLIPQMITALIIKGLFFAVAAIPVGSLYLIVRSGFDEGMDIGALYLYMNHLELLVVALIASITIFNLLSDSLVQFAYTIYYNSFTEEYNDLKWNLKGSLSSFFQDKKLRRKSLKIELINAIIMTATLVGLIKITTMITTSTDVVVNIKVITGFKALGLLLFAILDSWRSIKVHKIVANKINEV